MILRKARCNDDDATDWLSYSLRVYDTFLTNLNVYLLSARFLNLEYATDTYLILINFFLFYMIIIY